MTMDNDFEELMHSYGLDPSNPDHLDELLYRIGVENNHDPSVFDPDNLYDKLSDFVELDNELDEDIADYSDDDGEYYGVQSEDC